MQRDVRVIIIEDDPYARDLMTLLLARDWRTRVVADLSTEAETLAALEPWLGRVDVVIYDTEIPGREGWPARLVEQLRSRPNPPAVLLTATCVNPSVARLAAGLPTGGYVLKGEARYALAWAVVLASQGRWVMTPGVRALYEQLPHPLHKSGVVLNTRAHMAGLTEREEEIARLAILLNMARRNLADELQISPDWAFEVVSLAYQKLGLSEVLAGEVSPESYLPDNPIICDSFRDILSHLQLPAGTRKSMDMDTLAFHLLTVPDVEELGAAPA